MATKIIHKKSSVASSIPAAGDLEPGEIAVNLADQKLYSKTTSGDVIELGGVASNTEFSRKVWSSGNGTVSDSNYWAKVATYSISGNYNDGSFIYHFMPEESGGLEPAILSVQVRTHDVSSNQDNTIKLSFLAKPGAFPFNDNAFKIIDNGSGTDFELWVTKNVNYCVLDAYEMSSHTENTSNFSVTYHDNFTWQATEPTGTGNNVRSNGVVVGGKLTVTDLDVTRTVLDGLDVETRLGVEASTGYGRVEIGGPDGGYIDLKSPFSDDYDGRIITTGSGLVLTTAVGSSSGVSLQYENTTKLTTTSTGVNVTGTVNANSVDLGTFVVTETNGHLYFSVGGVNKMKLDSSGNLQVVGNVDSNATIT